MKQLIVYVFALIMLGSCHQRTGSGKIVREDRKTGDFKGISVGGAFTVELKTGPETKVEVEADDNIIGLIETKVSGDVLKIRTEDLSGFNNAHFKVYITAPVIKSIDASGAANVKVTNQLKDPGKISLDASGAASITASVDAPEITAEISGAGHMDLSGRTRDYTASVSGGGELKSGDLKSENTDVKVSGAGNARVHASVNLKAEASGAGNVHYTGEANVQQKTSGAGNVKNAN